MVGSRLVAAPASALVLLAVFAGTAGGSYIEEEFEGPDRVIPPPEPPQPAPRRHVPELADYLPRLRVGEPVPYRSLVVYPLMLRGKELSGRWLTMDGALSGGVLQITELAGGGSVPHVAVENRSERDHVFILGGELLAGGKQTRTVRSDIVLAPGQRVRLDVYCVEAGRWSGGDRLSAGGAVVPQSIQKQLRKGTDQSVVWKEVARTNRALGAESDTDSLEAGLNAKDVRDDLAGCRRQIVPHVPGRAVGFVFARGRQVLGAELFGRSELARGLLPKLVDAYAVDLVARWRRREWEKPVADRSVARGFLDRIRRAGSDRASTGGSGAGIRTRADRLVGEGVSLGGDLVHYGCQPEPRVVPAPEPIAEPVPQPRGGRPHVD